MVTQTNVPIENFSIPAGSDQDIYFTVATTQPDDTLEGATVYWRVYEQEFGAPVDGVAPVLEKSTESGHGISILPSPPMTFRVSLLRADTLDLLRNYYHEALLVDATTNKDPIVCGIMTVTPTENRLEGEI